MNYRLTLQAKEDLRRIYEHGFREFGEAQADRYFEALINRFDNIAANPYSYVSVNHIRQGYRRSVCGVDSIYYRIAGDGMVEIMTIIGRQDIDRFFREH